MIFLHSDPMSHRSPFISSSLKSFLFFQPPTPLLNQNPRLEKIKCMHTTNETNALTSKLPPKRSYSSTQSGPAQIHFFKRNNLIAMSSLEIVSTSSSFVRHDGIPFSIIWSSRNHHTSPQSQSSLEPETGFKHPVPSHLRICSRSISPGLGTLPFLKSYSSQNIPSPFFGTYISPHVAKPSK